MSIVALAPVATSRMGVSAPVTLSTIATQAPIAIERVTTLPPVAVPLPPLELTESVEYPGLWY